jgi:hypothetical protein
MRMVLGSLETRWRFMLRKSMMSKNNNVRVVMMNLMYLKHHHLA